MPNEHTAFWLRMLNLDVDQSRRARLWNGYLGWQLTSRVEGNFDPNGGWPQLIVDPPEAGWPQLTNDERQELNTFAKENGGHPELLQEYMNFEGYEFCDEVDLSGLILIAANFTGATFGRELRLSDKTQFYAQTRFCDANFHRGLHCSGAIFHAPVSFSGVRFEQKSTFINTVFKGEAIFSRTVFKGHPMFNGSSFDDSYYSGRGLIPRALADFRKAQFPDGASFRYVRFGEEAFSCPSTLSPERSADFTDAEFGATTIFRGASFAGPPAFFNTTLHEDTDFGSVDWSKANVASNRADYAVRAWERLELMMNRLEKPLDRHQFFRLKMRALRRTEGHLVRILNWLFEHICDYGWGVGRAFVCWLGHWVTASIVLFVNSSATATWTECWRLALAALGSGFSNAHAFLFLMADGGPLEAAPKILEEREKCPILIPLVETLEAILGPILLFLLLLTLRNRFRLG